MLYSASSGQKLHKAPLIMEYQTKDFNAYIFGYWCNKFSLTALQAWIKIWQSYGQYTLYDQYHVDLPVYFSAFHGFG